MPAERIDIQAVRAPQIVRKSRQDEFLDSAACFCSKRGVIET
jgi:hypothetical protein